MSIKVKRELAADSTAPAITDLAGVVADWKRRFPRARRDMVWEYCRAARDFSTAVERACGSRSEDGRLHHHQSRVKAAARAEFAKRIRGQKTSLSNSKAFDALHDRLDKLKPEGIGPVTLYDVATRIGAYLSLHPTSLYLHAGVRIGLRALVPHIPELYRAHRLTAEQLQEFFPEFDGLPADEVEDLLCAYSHVFPDIIKEENA